ncbi:MAG: class D sortase [Clostridia bacterium]
MRRIHPLGALLSFTMGASLVVLGTGAYQLIAVDKTLEDGAARTRSQLTQSRGNSGAAGGSSERAPDLSEDQAVGILVFRGDERTATPVFYGTCAEVLEKGVGQAEDTAKLNTSGNAVLFGHRDSGLRELANLTEGDALTVETAESVVTYTVRSIYITDPDDPHIYDETEETLLTLVTCYPFLFVGPAPERCVVVASPAA